MAVVKKQKQIQMTKVTFKKLKKELKDRKEKMRKKIAKKLAAAADFGDRSENAAYSAAVDARDANESRIAELETIVSDAVIVKKDKGNKDSVVSVGDTVEVTLNGKKEVYEMAGAAEGDAANGKLSIDSPVGQAIAGKTEGEKATVEVPIGKIDIVIKKIK